MLVAIITLSVILLDMISKYLTVQLLVPLDRDVTVIPYILDFCYVENKGAAFGMLSEARWVFMILSAFLIVFIVLFLKFSKINHPLFIISASFILGGGIGNMIDRIFVGYVVDFLKVTFIDFPVFNIADSAVVIGTALMAIYFIYDGFTSSKKTEGKEN